jgi:hypothetical protein
LENLEQSFAFNKDAEPLFSAIGCAVAVCQNVEKCLRGLTELVFPLDPSASLEILAENYDKAHRDTAGNFIKALRARAQLEPDFDQDLTKFLKMRNDLIHDLYRITDFDLKTIQGRKAGETFALTLASLAMKILTVLSPLQMQWYRDIGFTQDEIDKILNPL